tara:strand:+ start:325 stop:522 length:198 start_codon:yes stop_codon:yes gene_type:complete
MTTCFETEIAGHKITLKQTKRGWFSVQYGLQFDIELGYSEACKKLGQAILHALACEGKLNNDGPE